MKAVVSGMIATYPVGGVAWDYVQYALGLARLGFEVTYLEDTGLDTYDPIRREYGGDPSYGIAFLERTLAAIAPEIGRRWHVRAGDGRGFGLETAAVEAALAEADLFLNVSGAALVREACLRCPRKVLIDTDPGWNQFVNYPRWDASPGWLGTHGWRAHDFFFTYAERIGRPGCDIPSLGIDWHPTRPPVLLDAWKAEPPGERFTTVMTWDNFRRPIEHAGAVYGTKELEFQRIEQLPRHTRARLEVAIGGAAAPLERWRGIGWSVIDSHAVSATAADYRSYLQASRGELSVAKNVYVATRSGWFSCRSACYLAAGRPVVLQDTGFAEVLPVGAGLLAFADLDGAARALEAVERDYAAHATAARELAAERFAAERVLADLLARVGLN